MLGKIKDKLMKRKENEKVMELTDWRMMNEK
jgi:hypothetical protein